MEPKRIDHPILNRFSHGATDLLPRKKLIVSTLECIYVIEHEQISYIEADGNYSYIHKVDSEQGILTSKRLKYYEQKLRSQLFVRSHQSFLVNADQITKFQCISGGLITLRCGTEIPGYHVINVR